MKKIRNKISQYLNLRTEIINLLKHLKILVEKQDIEQIKKNQLNTADYLERNLYNNVKYQDNKRLNRYEQQVFSQYGEDGILSEIFNRLKIKNGFFVEFGVETGIECNSTNLLLKKWKGLWIEGSKKYYDIISEDFSKEISEKTLSVVNTFVSPENIETIFNQKNIPLDFDLLSIDIDYNDFHIWKSINKYNPKVIVIEYNATFDAQTEFVVDYKETGNDGIFTSHFGASLYSLELLGKEKGYCLVGCSYSGVNAFFVRQDLVKDLFQDPYTAKYHYEPPRYFLYNKSGHKRSWKNK